jgi:phage repressor protein C with HTH and peptisase S24 domain
MFYDNLKAVCDSKNLKITPTIIECGGAQGSVSNWKKGASPNSDIVARLAEYLNVSTDLLILGKESSSSLSGEEQAVLEKYRSLTPENKIRITERLDTLREIEEAETSVITVEETTYIELYELPVSAGTGIILDSCGKEMIKILRSEIADEANFALRISGDSMEPVFHDGDIALVRSQPQIEIGEIGIFILNECGYIKELGSGRLISFNDNYGDIPLHEYDSIYCRGKVIGILEKDDIVG